jgi:hypothetical protein
MPTPSVPRSLPPPLLPAAGATSVDIGLHEDADDEGSAFRRILFRMAAFRNKLRPSAFCLAQTAIFELPLSTMLLAGRLNGSESLEVIKKSRSLRFFFLGDENSPSMSVRGRARLMGVAQGMRNGRGDGGNESTVEGRGVGRNVKSFM